MTRVGVTGHRTIPDSSRWTWVRAELVAALRDLPPPLDGISALAGGADQLFADVVLDLGGVLHAVVPFAGFAGSLPPGPEHEGFVRLLDRATTVDVLPDATTPERAYLAAGRQVVDRCEVLVAIWDGAPARGEGGTGDIVEYALAAGTRTLRVDPVHATVEWC